MSNVKHHVEPRSASQAQWGLSAFKPKAWAQAPGGIRLHTKTAFLVELQQDTNTKKVEKGIVKNLALQSLQMPLEFY